MYIMDYDHWVSYGRLVLAYIPKCEQRPFVEWLSEYEDRTMLYERDPLEAVLHYVLELYR